VVCIVKEFSIDMIDLFGDEVYNGEYEVEDCHVHRNSPMCTPCKKCGKLTFSISAICTRHGGNYRNMKHYYWKKLEKMAEKSEVLKENSQ